MARSVPDAIGVDIGGTNVRVGRLRHGELVAVLQRPHRSSHYGEQVDYERVVGIVAELIGEISQGGDSVGVGISISGILSADRLRLLSNAGLGWFGQALAADVHAATGLPTVMDNDGNCATRAEYCLGVGRGRDPFVLLVLGTGVGGGTVINGRVIDGGAGAAGELGHICVVTDGRDCPCGAQGCLEQYASGRALIRKFAMSVAEVGARASTEGPDRLTIADYRWLEGRFARCLANGDPRAMEALSAIAEPIAAAVAILVRIFDPSLVAIGGGVSAIGESLLGAVTTAVRCLPAIESRKMTVPIKLAHFRGHAGLVGAAMLAAERTAGLDRSPRLRAERSRVVERRAL